VSPEIILCNARYRALLNYNDRKWFTGVVFRVLGKSATQAHPESPPPAGLHHRTGGNIFRNPMIDRIEGRQLSTEHRTPTGFGEVLLVLEEPFATPFGQIVTIEIESTKVLNQATAIANVVDSTLPDM
jgi:hypothetical protein